MKPVAKYRILGVGVIVWLALCTFWPVSAYTPPTAPSGSMQMRRYLVSRNGIEIRLSGEMIDAPDGFIVDGLREPAFRDGTLYEFFIWAQEEFERRCCERLPSLGKGTRPHITSPVIVEFKVDTTSQVSGVRVLVAYDRQVGAAAKEIVEEGASHWLPARVWIRSRDAVVERKTPVQVWLMLTTSDLWNRARAMKKADVPH